MLLNYKLNIGYMLGNIIEYRFSIWKCLSIRLELVEIVCRYMWLRFNWKNGWEIRVLLIVFLIIKNEKIDIWFWLLLLYECLYIFI